MHFISCCPGCVTSQAAASGTAPAGSACIISNSWWNKRPIIIGRLPYSTQQACPTCQACRASPDVDYTHSTFSWGNGKIICPTTPTPTTTPQGWAKDTSGIQDTPSPAPSPSQNGCHVCHPCTPKRSPQDCTTTTTAPSTTICSRSVLACICGNGSWQCYKAGCHVRSRHSSDWVDLLVQTCCQIFCSQTCQDHYNKCRMLLSLVSGAATPELICRAHK